MSLRKYDTVSVIKNENQNFGFKYYYKDQSLNDYIYSYVSNFTNGSSNISTIAYSNNSQDLYIEDSDYDFDLQNSNLLIFKNTQTSDKTYGIVPFDAFSNINEFIKGNEGYNNLDAKFKDRIRKEIFDGNEYQDEALYPYFFQRGYSKNLINEPNMPNLEVDPSSLVISSEEVAGISLYSNDETAYDTWTGLGNTYSPKVSVLYGGNLIKELCDPFLQADGTFNLTGVAGDGYQDVSPTGDIKDLYEFLIERNEFPEQVISEDNNAFIQRYETVNNYILGKSKLIPINLVNYRFRESISDEYIYLKILFVIIESENLEGRKEYKLFLRAIYDPYNTEKYYSRYLLDISDTTGFTGIYPIQNQAGTITYGNAEVIEILNSTQVIVKFTPIDEYNRFDLLKNYINSEQIEHVYVDRYEGYSKKEFIRIEDNLGSTYYNNFPYAISYLDKFVGVDLALIDLETNDINDLIEFETTRTVKVATNFNIILSGLKQIDGYLTKVGDRVLVKDQNDPKENGIYIADRDNWRRAEYLDNYPDPEIYRNLKVIRVIEGIRNINKSFKIVSTGTGVGGSHQIGIDSIIWNRYYKDVIKTGTNNVNIPDRSQAGDGINIDGYLTQVDDRVLLIGQDDKTENGIWVVERFGWTRPEDFDNVPRSEVFNGSIINDTSTGTMYQITSFGNGTDEVHRIKTESDATGTYDELTFTVYEEDETYDKITKINLNQVFKISNSSYSLDGSNKIDASTMLNNMDQIVIRENNDLIVLDMSYVFTPNGNLRDLSFTLTQERIKLEDEGVIAEDEYLDRMYIPETKYSVVSIASNKNMFLYDYKQKQIIATLSEFNLNNGGTVLNEYEFYQNQDHYTLFRHKTLEALNIVYYSTQGSDLEKQIEIYLRDNPMYNNIYYFELNSNPTQLSATVSGKKRMRFTITPQIQKLIDLNVLKVDDNILLDITHEPTSTDMTLSTRVQEITSSLIYFEYSSKDIPNEDDDQITDITVKRVSNLFVQNEYILDGSYNKFLITFENTTEFNDEIAFSLSDIKLIYNDTNYTLDIVADKQYSNVVNFYELPLSLKVNRDDTDKKYLKNVRISVKQLIEN
jgi:hypothetical protein